MKLHELFTEANLITEASSGYATADDKTLLFVQKQLVGQELIRISMTDPSSAIKIEKVEKHNLADDNTYLIRYTKYEDWHPMKSHREYQDAFLKKIGKWISKGTKVAFESQNWQKEGLLGLNIDVKSPYDDKFVGGLLHHVKEGIPVIVGRKANANFRLASEIVNKYVLKNDKDVITCQRELIENDLDEYAE